MLQYPKQPTVPKRPFLPKSKHTILLLFLIAAPIRSDELSPPPTPKIVSKSNLREEALSYLPSTDDPEKSSLGALPDEFTSKEKLLNRRKRSQTNGEVYALSEGKTQERKRKSVKHRRKRLESNVIVKTRHHFRKSTDATNNSSTLQPKNETMIVPPPTMYPTHSPPTLFPTITPPTLYPTHGIPTLYPTHKNPDTNMWVFSSSPQESNSPSAPFLTDSINNINIPGFNVPDISSANIAGDCAIENESAKDCGSCVPVAQCPEGEVAYYTKYPEVKPIYDALGKSAFDHWMEYGKVEGRVYECNCAARCCEGLVCNSTRCVV